ncbi:MAG: prolipoprotein diacylglyceryl transferase [Deltaproteobacteria bacterium]|nr:prolipoprotein diacylglyceryl transferase [Deltaproteobacteria bacterium]
MLPVLYTFVIPAALAPFVVALLAIAMGAWQAFGAKKAGAPQGEVIQTAATWSIGTFALLAVLVRAMGDTGNTNLFALTSPLRVPLHTYGLLIATAFLVAMSLAGRNAEKSGLSKDRVLDLSFWILISAMIGSRVLFIIVNWDDYAHDPLSVFAFWKGGLVFYGGFIGAASFSVWYMRKHQMSFFPYADALIPSVSIGHAIGRLGCFAAGCCWGGACDPHFALAAHFPPESLAYQSQLSHHVIMAGAPFSIAIHPTQLYESFGELCIFTFLTLWRPKKQFSGQILAFWLMLYAPLRSTVEILRGDEERGRVFNFLGNMARGAWWNLSTSELISLGIFATGLVIWIVQSRGERRELAAA